MMEDGLDGLTLEQQEAVALVREVIADDRGTHGTVQLLRSCNWNIEQAVQLHWASHDEEAHHAAAARGTGSGSGAGGALGAPLLGNSFVPPTANNPRPPPPAQERPTGSGVFDWLARGIRRIGSSFFHVVCTFFFGPGAGRIGGGTTSGAAFRQLLLSSYGAQLRLPQFFEGSFSQALAAARRDLRLLVIYLHSDNARYTQSFCTDVLGNEFVRTMLDENFVLWGGDVARMETHQVAQMIHARQYPYFCVLLPASIDEIRVIGARHGEVQVDAVVALLTACLEEMDAHRAEIVARREQHQEDRYLREQQDREYQEALEMDRLRAEQQQLLEQEQLAAKRAAEEQRRKEEEEVARQEAERCALLLRRQQSASSIEAVGEDAKSRISLRLPAGQRVERKFRSTATLADVYTWADCVAYLPENQGKTLDIPHRFKLKTSFPSRDLTEMDKTIEELQLAGTNILLEKIEDDDE